MKSRLLLISLLASVTSFGQTNPDYNPDYDDDGFISVNDILGVLSTFGETWDSGDAIMECGNGILDPGEECDDGNNLPNDGCDGCLLVNTPPSIQFGGWQIVNGINYIGYYYTHTYTDVDNDADYSFYRINVYHPGG